MSGPDSAGGVDVSGDDGAGAGTGSLPMGGIRFGGILTTGPGLTILLPSSTRGFIFSAAGALAAEVLHASIWAEESLDFGCP